MKGYRITDLRADQTYGQTDSWKSFAPRNESNFKETPPEETPPTKYL